MKRLLSKVWFWFALLAAGMLACVCVVFLDVYPVGVRSGDLYAFWFASIATESASPQGVVVRHVLNDAGAAHSGLHYVWVVGKRAPWLPWRVLVSGWSEARDAEQAITWLDGTTFEIELSHERSGVTRTMHRIQLSSE